ncbi:MAG TPA: aromatic hydrocarbon degradation protein [Bacteroidales bacterium]|nr:aromatic hydrocarbon degradation protein [Bacteroidales bacterium]HOX73638.1 aromatic hydrocarbon degradation protein [Bacteroidales bacterium]HPM86766.1 aromatic hydrocarbon degradation protein [Bacteroidales bacterium]HQM68893.1 aromatic hydrocarbon degradation protein [Bacteroidales bacterium]
MRKLLTIIALTFISGSLIAGGLVTNNNQSIKFNRLQNRNASTDIDAVFYNPAGLTKLGNGFYVSLNNQSVFQTKTVTNNYQYLSKEKPRTYIGEVRAPLYPGVYLAFNTGRLSFSAGVNPVGGGGGAEYAKGVPSFESQIADLVPSLVAQGIPTTNYDAFIFFKGSSTYLGYQANVAYKISDMLSVAIGGRLVSAKNAYEGYMKNISINPNFPTFGPTYDGRMVLAKNFFTAGATFFNSLPALATGAAAQLQPAITAGYGTVLLANGASIGMSEASIKGIQSLLGAKGMTPQQIGAATISAAQTELNTASPVYLAKAAAMTGYAGRTSDVVVDAEQSGKAFTPILSVNFSPSEKLNIALKYEFKTKLDLKTKVIDGKNGGGIYIQDSVSIADLPAILFLGAEYKPFNRLTLAGTFNCYFDKGVDYDGQSDVDIEKIDKNFLEFGLGAEFGITEKLRISAGWLATATGVNPEKYNTDLTYSTNTNTFGGGIGYRISPMLDLNIGTQYTFYKDGTNTLMRLKSYEETYAKKTWIIGAGLDFYFGKK